MIFAITCFGDDALDSTTAGDLKPPRFVGDLDRPGDEEEDEEDEEDEDEDEDTAAATAAVFGGVTVFTTALPRAFFGVAAPFPASASISKVLAIAGSIVDLEI